jgi:hypothetical protein
VPVLKDVGIPVKASLLLQFYRQPWTNSIIIFLDLRYYYKFIN